jgi:hypothetical protein
MCSCHNQICQSIGKHPRTRGGLKDATTNVELITEWWTRWPDANIGIATGEASGFIALDVDPRHGGDESLRSLIAQHEPLPNTVESITGGDGQHILFNYPGLTVKNRVNIVPGLDIRGDGGYIVVAPSLHATGKRYEWELSRRPLEVSLSNMPEWLLKITVDATRGNKKPASHWREIAFGVKEGQRNNAVASLTGRLLSRGFDAIEVAALVMAWNTCYNRPPLSGREVKRTIDSIAKREWNRRNKEGAV